MDDLLTTLLVFLSIDLGSVASTWFVHKWCTVFNCEQRGPSTPAVLFRGTEKNENSNEGHASNLTDMNKTSLPAMMVRVESSNHVLMLGLATLQDGMIQILGRMKRKITSWLIGQVS